VGFSDESHSTWEKRPKNVTLLHTTTDAIEKLASVKSISGKIDLMYTYFGLQHLDTKPLTTHLIKLKKALAINGKIIMRPNELKYLNQAERIQLIKTLEENGYKATVQEYPRIVLGQQNTTAYVPGINSIGLIELERIN